MCGITGIFDPLEQLAPQRRQAVAVAMADALAHRGPDDAGVWADGPVALSHRRLSIIDLSPLGHQPMASPSGRYHIVFNGEIYNFAELKQALPAQQWRGGSDTEVLIAAIEAWGVEKALAQLNGMFAFAVWDRQTRSLTLARDRMGEKPLYYGWIGGVFAFSSELRALRAVPGFAPSYNLTALQEFFTRKYIPAPLSVYEGIHKLRAAHWVEVSRGADGAPAAQVCYWDLAAMAEAGRQNPLPLDQRQAEDLLEQTLLQSVTSRLVADVPVGVFLSGGVDSSIVAALASKTHKPLRTFSIGFDDPRYDEAVHARQTAAHLGSQHTEYYVSEADLLNIVPTLPQIYDEPFADFSQIPTALLCRLTRQQVTVALSGDGGDELFAGYPRQWDGAQQWQRLRRTFAPWRWLKSQAGKALQGSASYRLGKWHRQLSLNGCQTFAEFYSRRFSVWDNPARLLQGRGHSAGLAPVVGHEVEGAALSALTDSLLYLPEDLMTKTDRASMTVGLEARAPLLDHKLVELVWQLPPALRLQPAKGMLKHVLFRHVPAALIDRPKQGFEPPLASWLRGPLQEWAKDLLQTPSDILDMAMVQNRWHLHQSSRRSFHQALWCVLMFKAWEAAFRG